MNTWVLHSDLPQIAEKSSDPNVDAVVAAVLENYLYPVDDQVISPEGKLLDHLEANDAQGDEARYEQLLDSAARYVKPTSDAARKH